MASTDHIRLLHLRPGQNVCAPPTTPPNLPCARTNLAFYRARLLIEPVEEWNISSGGFHSREGSFYLGGNVEGVGFKGVVFKVPEEVKERKMVLDLGMSVFGNGARLVLRAEGWGDGEEGEVDSDEEFEYL